MFYLYVPIWTQRYEFGVLNSKDAKYENTHIHSWWNFIDIRSSAAGRCANRKTFVMISITPCSSLYLDWGSLIILKWCKLDCWVWNWVICPIRFDQQLEEAWSYSIEWSDMRRKVHSLHALYMHSISRWERPSYKLGLYPSLPNPSIDPFDSHQPLLDMDMPLPLPPLFSFSSYQTHSCPCPASLGLFRLLLLLLTYNLAKNKDIAKNKDMVAVIFSLTCSIIQKRRSFSTLAHKGNLLKKILIYSRWESYWHDSIPWLRMLATRRN